MDSPTTAAGLRELLAHEEHLGDPVPLFTFTWAESTDPELLQMDRASGGIQCTFAVAFPDVPPAPTTRDGTPMGASDRLTLDNYWRDLGPMVAKPAQFGGRPRPAAWVLNPAAHTPPLRPWAIVADFDGADLLRAVASRLGTTTGLDTGEATQRRIDIEQNTYRALADQLDARAMDTWNAGGMAGAEWVADALEEQAGETEQAGDNPTNRRGASWR